ncbi:uncharacterized protein LOC143151204 isoform X2 [Ptiloglossa arizonensis]|uniref:uncharacterized protein LOC143151204 isoform X2 n=1 Tax=Ptiloglossa arizonensis TaxID=3350558 RepID=UPI003FA06E51
MMLGQCTFRLNKSLDDIDFPPSVAHGCLWGFFAGYPLKQPAEKHKRVSDTQGIVTKYHQSAHPTT